MTPEAYLDALLTLPALYGAVPSRDGKWVAWSWFNTGPGADVYVAPTDGAAPPTRLTETDEDTIILDWTADSRSVLVSQDHDGDERAQIFRVDLDRPGVMVPLTAPHPGYFLRGGELHPNGQWLIYGANWDTATGTEIEPTWIYRHDLTHGERRVLARPQQPAFTMPQLNEPGTHILYERSDLDPAGVQVWLVDIEGRADREVLNVGAGKKVSAVWFPDGQHALVLAETATHRRLGRWDRTNGALEWLIDDPARNIEAAFVPDGVDNALAVVIEIREARPHVSFLHLASGAEEPLPAAPGALWPLRPLDDSAWLATYASAQQPLDIVRYDPRDPRPETFTSLTRIWERTPLRAGDLAPAQDFRWTAGDGRPIQGWLYLTQQEPPRGTIVYVHGGPTSHSEDRLNTQIQFYVAQGFNVLDPNYRGSTGFSLEFQESIKIDGWGGREQEDMASGIAALVAAGLAQPGRIGITGTSYGGYSAWWAITHWPPEVIAAAAPVCGMTDLVVDYESTRPDLRTYSAEMLGGRPDQVPDRYRERSPIHFVQNIRGRLLIVQGLQDPNVTPENVRAVRTALDAAGIPYAMLAFPDEGHGIARPANRRTLYPRLAAFFGAAFGTSE